MNKIATKRDAISSSFHVAVWRQLGAVYLSLFQIRFIVCWGRLVKHGENIIFVRGQRFDIIIFIEVNTTPKAPYWAFYLFGCRMARRRKISVEGYN